MCAADIYGAAAIVGAVDLNWTGLYRDTDWDVSVYYTACRVGFECTQAYF